MLRQPSKLVVRLVRQRAYHRVDEHAEPESRLVRVAGIVPDFDGEDPQGNVDLGSGEPRTVGCAHRVDDVVADAPKTGRAELRLRHLARPLTQRRVADLHDLEHGHSRR